VRDTWFGAYSNQTMKTESNYQVCGIAVMAQQTRKLLVISTTLFCYIAILLSTHYMDEAAQLGDRIAIFIDGEIISTGSLPELQAEYCNSYFVEVALTPSASSDDQEKTLEIFNAAGFPSVLYESLPYHFKLQVPFQSEDRVEQLACLFELIEARKVELNFKYYSIAQMSLEQIFIDLSRKQFDIQEFTRFVET